jgi:hypothetical protein
MRKRLRRPNRSHSWASVIVTLTVLVGGLMPQTAFAESEVSLTPSTTKPYYACPHDGCDGIIEPPATKTAAGYVLPDGTLLPGGGPEGGYTAEELRAAYGIPKTGGKEPEQQTVAVVVPWGDETAHSDLEKYREKNGMAPCTEESKCFRKFNQGSEKANYPKEGPTGWAEETAADLDMVSAACPECHIILVEANSEKESDMADAVITAVHLFATEISVSYGYPETEGHECGEDCESYKSDYEVTEYEKQPVVITVAAGNNGYDNHKFLFAEETAALSPSFPATVPSVIAVGGTELKIEKNARVSEKVWSESGSGCSLVEPKPSWQKDTEEVERRKGCEHRTDNDMAADASCATPVSIYRTIEKVPAWSTSCGTGVAAPFVAGIEAHASKHTRSLGVKAFYEYPSMLYHVSEGTNGGVGLLGCGNESEAKWYLCHATAEGYNGPAGLGTPDGVPEAPIWSQQTAPGVSGAYSSRLTADSCSSSLTCVAVGEYEPTCCQSLALAEGWNGKEWALQSVPNPAEAKKSTLESVSCTSSTVCTAVGFYYDKYYSEAKPLAERWNGSEWKVQAVPSPNGEKASHFTGVSCTSSTDCIAVGTTGRNGEGSEYSATFAEQWNGTEWSLQATVNPAEVQDDDMWGVSCSSSTACMATGYTFGKHALPLAESWNGKEWKLLSVPIPSEADVGILEGGVSCTSSTACTATGQYQIGEVSKGYLLAERWNGTEWKVQSVPVPSPEQDGAYFHGTSCTEATACTAVGTWITEGGAPRTFAETWNSLEWSVQPTPTPSGGSKAWEFRGVSCTTTVLCTAVGNYKPETGNQTVPVDRYE